MKISRYLSQCDASILSRVTEDFLRSGRHLGVAEQLMTLLRECVLLPEPHRAGQFVAFNTRVTYTSSAPGKPANFDLVFPRNGDTRLAERCVLSPFALAVLGVPAASTVPCVSSLGVEYIEVLRVSPLDCSDRQEPAHAAGEQP